jgi:hypothetical protein
MAYPCPGFEIDEFIIMPNHVHGIILINYNTMACAGKRAIARVAPTVGNFDVRCWALNVRRSSFVLLLLFAARVSSRALL